PNQCKPKEQPECTTDLNCKMNEFCNIPPGQSGGSCKEITGCGTVDNHKLTPYECGDGVSCPQCPAGEQCIDHACKTFSINCPATAIVGDEKQCTAMVDGEPCKECQVEVTDPSGRKTTLTTDQDGHVNIPFDTSGLAQIVLVQGGVPVQTQVNVLPKAPETQNPPPQAQSDNGLGFLWLIILLLLV